jgi:hypothetical protein
LRARLKIRPLLLRRHQRHDRGKVVRQRRSTDGKGGMRRHKANSAVGAREVQLSSTDPRSARCGGGMLAWNCMERVCGFQRTQNVPPSPKEVSSIACPTHWTRVHNASTSRKVVRRREVCSRSLWEGVAEGAAGWGPKKVRCAGGVWTMRCASMREAQWYLQVRN